MTGFPTGVENTGWTLQSFFWGEGGGLESIHGQRMGCFQEKGKYLVRKCYFSVKLKTFSTKVKVNYNFSHYYFT